MSNDTKIRHVKSGKNKKSTNTISLARFDSGADTQVVVRDSKCLKFLKKFENPGYCELTDEKEGKLD